MKYVNKYLKYFESEVVEVKPEKEVKVATEGDVLDRFNRIYMELSKEDKDEIDSYFKK